MQSNLPYREGMSEKMIKWGFKTAKSKWQSEVVIHLKELLGGVQL